MTKKYVYGLYVDAAKNTDDEPMSLHLWYQTWSDLCQNVMTRHKNIQIAYQKLYT